MNRGRWLALLLLSGFGVGVAALTLWRSEPESVVSTPLPVEAGSEVPTPSAANEPAAAIAAGNQAAPGVDAGAPTVAQPQAATRAQPSKPEQGGLEFFITTLEQGDSFRVRARAAMILGRTRSEQVLAALSRALRDPHPGVRAAVASGLAKQGPGAKAPLESALGRERDRKVQRALQSALGKLGGGAAPSAKPGPALAAAAAVTVPEPGLGRFYVGIGKATDPNHQLSGSTLGQLDATLRSAVSRLNGVRIAPAGESPSSAKQVLGSDGRSGFYLDVSVASVTHEPSVGTRATVSVMVGTYPGRDMRAMLKGAATLPGSPNDEESRAAAVQGALQSVVRKLPGVFAQTR